MKSVAVKIWLSVLLLLVAAYAAYLGVNKLNEYRALSNPKSNLNLKPLRDLSEFEFTERDGRTVRFADLKGKVVVLNFWATWCAPCREEMPGFSRLQERWRDRGVRFVGVSDEERPKVDRFADGIGIAYPLWTGDAEVMGLSKRLGNRLGVLPHTVLLDGDGRVLESRIGVYPEKLLEERLAAIVGKSR